MKDMFHGQARHWRLKHYATTFFLTTAVNIEWGSEHEYQPLLDNDYAALFEHNCNQYPNNPSAATNNLAVDPFLEDETDPVCASCYTAIEGYMFAPKEYYLDYT